MLRLCRRLCGELVDSLWVFCFSFFLVASGLVCGRVEWELPVIVCMVCIKGLWALTDLMAGSTTACRIRWCGMTG